MNAYVLYLTVALDVDKPLSLSAMITDFQILLIATIVGFFESCKVSKAKRREELYVERITSLNLTVHCRKFNLKPVRCVGICRFHGNGILISSLCV